MRYYSKVNYSKRKNAIVFGKKMLVLYSEIFEQACAHNSRKIRNFFKNERKEFMCKSKETEWEFVFDGLAYESKPLLYLIWFDLNSFIDLW